MELKWRKMLSLLLSMVLTLSLFPASARADEGGTEDNVPKNEYEITLSAAADELGEDAALVVPEAEDSEGAVDEDAGLVRVLFICDPEDAVVTVYDPMNLDDEGGYLVVDPEEDGSWLLYPHAYLYNAVCEGYESAERVSFEVEHTGQCLSGFQIINIDLALLKDSHAAIDSDDYPPSDTVSSSSYLFKPRWPFSSVGYDHYIRVVDNYSPSYSSKDHYGMDIKANMGDPVLAVESGKVINVVNSKPDTYEANSWGNYVKIEHQINGKKYYSLYAHLQQGSVTVSVGNQVSKGTAIGKVGTSGSSDGPHLHIELNEGTRWTQSFDYYKENPSSIAGVWFNSNSKKYSKHYSEWITNNCVPVVHGNTTFYEYNPSNSPTTYTVTYNANGGYGAPSPQTKTHGVNLTLSSAEPSRSSTSAGSFTVTLDPNGGSVSITRLAAARTESYIFQKWNTAANGSGTSYAPGATYSANASVTLYAQWYSSLSTAPITLPTPTRSGFVFKGWATDPSYSAGVNGSYMPTRDLTLYAIWASDAPKITISTSEIELDRVDHPSEKLYYTYSGDTENGYYISAEVTEPGVVSLSWGTEPKDHLAITGLKPGYVIVTIKLVEYNTEMTLSAAYCGVSITDPRTYVITFDANGGYGAPEPKIKTHDVDILVEGIAKRDSVYGEMLTLCFDATGGTVEPCEAHAQKITAYSFLAWNTAPNGSGTQFKNCFSYTGNADLTLYAQWDSIATSTSFTLPEPSWPGHRFLGWAAYKGGEPRYSAGMRVTLRASGTIYAVWEIMRIPGDVNGDGSVNGQDLIRLRKYLAGETVEIDLSNADVNGDGQVDGRDLIRLRKYLAGEEVVLV